MKTRESFRSRELNSYIQSQWASPEALVVKNPSAKAGDMGEGSTPGWGRPPGGGHGNPLWYFHLGNPTDRGACWLQSMGSQKSWTRLKRPSAHTCIQSQYLFIFCVTLFTDIGTIYGQKLVIVRQSQKLPSQVQNLKRFLLPAFERSGLWGP